MKTPFNSHSIALTLVLSSLGLILAGCGSTGVMPDSVVSPMIAGPSIEGSTYGGHAAIVGSHIYLLQPGVTGIGSAATSLLGNNGATSANGYVLTANVNDPHVPVGAKYVNSDSSGGFSLTGAYTCVVNQPVYIYSYGGNAGATQNNSITQMATLGNCPSSGNFSTAGNGQINFVYMNEVSTVASAYTFQPFTSASNNTAWDIGSTGTTQALQGIANAAATAAQLYAIQGNAQISSTNDGEGHIANYQTQSVTVKGTTITYTPNRGNGVVPQATIDTLANILAACVDSTPAVGGGPSGTCTTLFSNATDHGFTVASGDTAPTDTATAAINIARYPAGNHSTSTTANIQTGMVANLFALPTGTQPYAPNLANAPNEFTIAINYPQTAVTGYPGATNSLLGLAESIAVDSMGQIWVTAQTSNVILTLSPLGVQESSAFSSGGYAFGYVSIDGSDNAWTGNANCNTRSCLGSPIDEFNSIGQLINSFGAGYQVANTVVADSNSNVFFFARNEGLPDNTYNTSGDSQMWEYNSAGTLLSGNPGPCHGSRKYNGPFVFDCISGGGIGTAASHGAIDASGHLWLTSEQSPYQIDRVNSAGIADFPSLQTNSPEFPSIDKNGNAWVASNQTSSVIYIVTPTGAMTTLTSGSTGATLTSTFGSAVDGNNNIWFANRAGNGGAVSGAAGTNTLIQINSANDLAISPPSNYYPEAQYPATATTLTPILNGSLNLAIDPSGNIWVTNYTGSSLAEVVGAAAPVVTPLSRAAANNKFGVAP